MKALRAGPTLPAYFVGHGNPMNGALFECVAS